MYTRHKYIYVHICTYVHICIEENWIITYSGCDGGGGTTEVRVYVVCSLENVPGRFFEEFLSAVLAGLCLPATSVSESKEVET